MSTIADSYPRGCAQMIFVALLTRCGCSRGRLVLFERSLPGANSVNKLDCWAALIAGILGRRPRDLLPAYQDRRALRGCRTTTWPEKSSGFQSAGLWFVVCACLTVIRCGWLRQPCGHQDGPYVPITVSRAEGLARPDHLGAGPPFQSIVGGPWGVRARRYAEVFWGPHRVAV